VREMENIRLRECAEKGCIDPMNCLDETRSLFRLNQRTLSDRRSLRDRYANRSVAGDAKAVTLEEMRRHPSCTFPEFEIVE
ncbi:MAG: hypothetical protein FWC00_05035, partial [Firmicutes bacterium]|nr:hypothetical protein [Bacillota bacterium]